MASQKVRKAFRRQQATKKLLQLGHELYKLRLTGQNSGGILEKEGQCSSAAAIIHEMRQAIALFLLRDRAATTEKEL